MKKKWQKSLAEYLEKRLSLKGLVVLMDIRHPLKDLDADLIEWANDCGLPVLALLTKADKLKSGKRSAEVLKVRKECEKLHENIKVQAFSSLNRLGLDTANQIICDWFAYLEEQQVEEGQGEQE